MHTRGPYRQGATTVKGTYSQGLLHTSAISIDDGPLQTMGLKDKEPIQTMGPCRQRALTNKGLRIDVVQFLQTRGPYRQYESIIKLLNLITLKYRIIEI